MPSDLLQLITPQTTVASSASGCRPYEWEIQKIRSQNQKAERQFGFRQAVHSASAAQQQQTQAANDSMLRRLPLPPQSNLSQRHRGKTAKPQDDKDNASASVQATDAAVASDVPDKPWLPPRLRHWC